MSEFETIEMTDEDIDEYLDVALAVGTKTGFSKGTMNVSAADLKKLRPLVKFYAKKAHPFRACVNDNRKRFGPLTEKYCAIIKDLIKGTTKWRSTERKKSLSDQTLYELFGLNVPHDFFVFLSELDEDEVQSMLSEPEQETPEETEEEVETEEEETEVGFSQVMAELFLSEAGEAEVEDNLVWKPIMREGTWKFSPGAGGAVQKPITVVKSGKSDAENLILSMSELKKNFESGAVEHVTIPASHKDTVLENTGFIRKLRFTKDEQGRTVLEAGMDFTEPDVKEKALRGTIANTSAGVLFDYIHKESGKRFRSVLAHAALTNRPWLNGMKPFGVNASDDLKVLGFSEEPIDSSERREEMPEETGSIDFSEFGFEDAESLKAALAEAASLKAKARERDVADLAKKWQDDGKAPALVAEAQAIMMSDNGATVLNLSEDGKDVQLSASDIVKRLVEKAPGLDLTQDPVTDQKVSEEGPEDEEEVELSDDEKLIASRLYFDEGLPWEKAVEKAKKQTAVGSGATS